ncbi:hypothetical protein [Robiginitalea sp. SC105]|uniref:hypothetical protein n=1 Tax=Robiginitalea sp. SC105 TaxID=2762332 RepID=UPI001639A04D|nr:hypothetical protein [Robiginitalea sp. SC105]MBC2839852.1 hypothetical protein [Robiginitalea sp. SC105]
MWTYRLFFVLFLLLTFSSCNKIGVWDDVEIPSLGGFGSFDSDGLWEGLGSSDWEYGSFDWQGSDWDYFTFKLWAEQDFYCETTEMMYRNPVYYQGPNVKFYSNNQFTVDLEFVHGELYSTWQKNIFFDTHSRTGEWYLIEESEDKVTFELIYEVDGQERIEILESRPTVIQEADTTLYYTSWIVSRECLNRDTVSVWSNTWVDYMETWKN